MWNSYRREFNAWEISGLVEVRVLDCSSVTCRCLTVYTLGRVKQSDPSQHYKVFKGKLLILLDRVAVVCGATPNALVNCNSTKDTNLWYRSTGISLFHFDISEFNEMTPSGLEHIM